MNRGTHLPLTPLILYLAVCGGKNLLFPPPLAYNDLSTLTGHEESIYGLGICEVPAFTVPVEWVLTCIYPEVYTVQ